MIRSILISLFVIVISISAVQAGDANEKIYGIWVNKEYDATEAYPRWDYNSDGTWASYVKIGDQPVWGGKYTITEKWTDSEKNVWYKIKWVNTMTAYEGFGLLKISDSGNTIEQQFAVGDYPSKIDPSKGFWEYAGIHRRK
jgi:hypothetical protein